MQLRVLIKRVEDQSVIMRAPSSTHIKCRVGGGDARHKPTNGNADDQNHKHHDAACGHRKVHDAFLVGGKPVRAAKPGHGTPRRISYRVENNGELGQACKQQHDSHRQHEAWRKNNGRLAAQPGTRQMRADGVIPKNNKMVPSPTTYTKAPLETSVMSKKYDSEVNAEAMEKNRPMMMVVEKPSTFLSVAYSPNVWLVSAEQSSAKQC